MVKSDRDFDVDASLGAEGNPDDDKLDDLVEEYVALCRAGKRPALSEFIQRCPELADQIRELFPTLALIEDARDEGGSASHNLRPQSSAPLERIGEYRILREVGRGGMGIVYEAVQESLGRHVALKILPNHALLDSRLLHRFQREARSAARLHHTNIVPVFGVGEHDGLNFYAMQFIRGRSVDQVLIELKRAKSSTISNLHFPSTDRNSNLPESGTAYWFGIARLGAQVADALSYAHSQGVLHRDIKPSNLLLEADGTVWVTDFGLAKDTLAENSPDGLEQASLTKTGDIVGTLRYMAPELLKGQSDARSDIYSLGATLYELLTLRPAFDESDRKVFMRRLLHDEPTRPRGLESSIPIDLETIIVKAMAKEPEERYHSAADMAEDLGRFLKNVPILARRISNFERAWRTCRRNPLITSLSLAVMILVAALTAGFQMAGWIRSERDRALASADRALLAEMNAQTSLQRAMNAEKDAKIRGHLTQAIVQRKRDLPGRRVRAVAEIEAAMALSPPPSLQQELRNELVAALALTDIEPAKVWESPHGTYAIDAQFQHYARLTRDGTISLRRVNDNSEVRRLSRPPGPDNRAALKFSPDGMYIASFTFDLHVMVWRVSDGQLVLNDVGCQWEFAFDFTADSRALVIGHDREIVVHDLENQAVVSRWPVEFAPWCIACGPCDDWVAITPEGDTSSRKLQVFSWSTHELIAEWVAPKWVYDIDWHPDGKSLAYGCHDTNIYLCKVGSAKPYRKLTGSMAHGVRVAYSHDGSMLASSTWGQEFHVWESRTGELLCSARNSMLCLQFSEDDKQIAVFSDGAKIGTYNILHSEIFRNFVRGGNRDEGNQLLNAVFSLDGKLLLIGTEKGISVCDYPSGEERAFAPVGRTPYLHCDAQGNLLTSSRNLMHWPLVKTSEDDTHYTLGPARQTPLRSRSEFDVSREGKRIIVAGYDDATIADMNDPTRTVLLTPHEDCRYVAISRDGKWAATASHFGSKVKVWNAGTGELITTLPVESSSWVRFSPDGKWLATPVGARHLWRVGTWEAGPDMGGLITGFSEDGRMVAVDDLAGAVHLLDPETAREYVRLEHPSGYGADRYFFTPEGSELVAVGTARPSGFAWNLNRIYSALTSRGLEWDLPTQPRKNTEISSDDPLSHEKHIVKVEILSQPIETRSRAELAKLQIERCRKQLGADPNNTSILNELAWALLFAPSPLRDATEAVELATKALSLQPDNLDCRNTLGVAYYRAGKYREAVDCLAQNLHKQNDEGLPFDLFFLAMSHYQLGEQERGREVLVWANRWLDKLIDSPDFNPDTRGQLLEIRQEAEELISLP